MTDLTKLVTVIEPPATIGDLPAWLAGRANTDRPYLLAFADDGVIWGKWDGGTLRTSHDAAPSDCPVLRGETLQQAFVFGTTDEIRLFKDENGVWQARQVVDPADGKDVIQEVQVLWGDKFGQQLPYGFKEVWDKSQKVAPQVLPVEIDAGDYDPGTQDLKFVPRLEIHHFVEYDQKTGEARIGLSRLARLGIGPAEKEEVVK